MTLCAKNGISSKAKEAMTPSARTNPSNYRISNASNYAKSTLARGFLK
jgi:hypothetical protein